ncbi:hypothetical protein [Leptolyngbya sp. PCC 6406]|uniref:hypothetical protein n=1 Tax=Leptolyngbya sp. PCC 6406 TaxID=1173264 RepID=UPI00138B0489
MEPDDEDLVAATIAQRPASRLGEDWNFDAMDTAGAGICQRPASRLGEDWNLGMLLYVLIYIVPAPSLQAG